MLDDEKWFYHAIEWLGTEYYNFIINRLPKIKKKKI